MGGVDCERVGVDIGSLMDGQRIGACEEQKRTGRNASHRVNPGGLFSGPCRCLLSSLGGSRASSCVSS